MLKITKHKNLICVSLKNNTNLNKYGLIKRNVEFIYLKKYNNINSLFEKNIRKYSFVPIFIPMGNGGSGGPMGKGKAKYLSIALGHFLIMFVVLCLTIDNIDYAFPITLLTYLYVSVFFPLYILYYVLVGRKTSSSLL